MTALPHEVVLGSCLLVMVAYKIAMEDSCIGIVQYVHTKVLGHDKWRIVSLFPVQIWRGLFVLLFI